MKRMLASRNSFLVSSLMPGSMAKSAHTTVNLFPSTGQIPIVRACNVVGLSRSMWYSQSKRDDSEVIDKLTELAEAYPTRGFDEYYHKIRREGLKWNRKRVLRVYREMKLSLRRRHKKRLVKRVKQPLETPSKLNECWSIDFMSDALTDGRKVRVFNVIDN